MVLASENCPRGVQAEEGRELQTVLQVIWGLTPRAGERQGPAGGHGARDGLEAQSLGTRASLLQAWEPWQVLNWE